MRARASASAVPRCASARARAARSTSPLTTAATATNTKIANRLAGSAMVHVWIGGVKYQLMRSELASAAKSAGHNPPTAAMATTASR